MKKFYISDIHGSYREMIELFNFAKINHKKDLLVIGGDMINRGNNSGRVVQKLKELSEKYPEKVKILCGNHEEMALWYHRGKNELWLNHNGIQTKADFKKTFDSFEEKEVYEWLRGLPIIYEDEEFIYTHAGLNINNEIKQQNREILWNEREDIYEMQSEELLKYTKGKLVVHGHIPNANVMFDGSRISCDLGANVLENGKLGLIELTEGIYYAYDYKTKKITKEKIKNAYL